jgi:hypothetical protein
MADARAEVATSLPIHKRDDQHSQIVGQTSPARWPLAGA